MPLPSPITLTDAAAERVKAILATREKPALGLKISVASKGCSGLSYKLDYAEEKGPHDEVISDKGVTILDRPQGDPLHLRNRDRLRGEQAAVGICLPQSQ